jgi:hypothetical protein
LLVGGMLGLGGALLGVLCGAASVAVAGRAAGRADGRSDGRFADGWGGRGGRVVFFADAFCVALAAAVAVRAGGADDLRPALALALCLVALT